MNILDLITEIGGHLISQKHTASHVSGNRVKIVVYDYDLPSITYIVDHYIYKKVFEYIKSKSL